MRYDAVIIGAGMSGLAAAIRLAQFDRRVVVLERHEVWGGLNSFYTLGGRRFDVGLHALTNWAPPRTKGAPLTRLLRQLRLRHADLRLGEQGFSEILFPGERLTFTNDFGHLQAEIERAFPAQRDGFARLVRAVRDYELREDDDEIEVSGREVLGQHLSDPLLVEMLLLPLLYYGSAREDDVDWRQLVVLFRSIFLEGLARPEGGIRTLLNLLVKRLKREGAELRLRTGVRRVLVEGGVAKGVELDDEGDGEILEADAIFSSAGWVETMNLCGADVARERLGPADEGRLSFLESISVLDRPAAELGSRAATSFFCARERLSYRRPERLVDTDSGVISIPDNFRAEKPPESMVRLTVLADHDRWCALPDEEYARRKEECAERAIASAAPFLFDWRPHTVFRDVFTPRTIRHFTGHAGGAVYGSPRKHPSGETGVGNVYLIGTDQGYLGVIGSLISGVTMANRHALAPAMR